MTVIIAMEAIPTVLRISSKILLLIRITSTTIFNDLTVRMINKYFMTMAHVQFSAFGKKKLH
jgi:hypothetical protein